jgi:hypothetical protein
MSYRFVPALPLLLLVSACAGQEAKAPNPMRPIDERRAIPIIAQAYADSGVSASEGRDIQLGSGKALHVDVGTNGHKYGVAYMTTGDVSGLDTKTDLPPHQPGGDLLPVVKGAGPDADAVILVLFAEDYQYDDLAGEQHESTTITAERKLTRDVRDFLVQARSQNLP